MASTTVKIGEKSFGLRALTLPLLREIGDQEEAVSEAAAAVEAIDYQIVALHQGVALKADRGETIPRASLTKVQNESVELGKQRRDAQHTRDELRIRLLHARLVEPPEFDEFLGLVDLRDLSAIEETINRPTQAPSENSEAQSSD